MDPARSVIGWTRVSNSPNDVGNVTLDLHPHGQLNERVTFKVSLAGHRDLYNDAQDLSSPRGLLPGGEHFPSEPPSHVGRSCRADQTGELPADAPSS
jgi:hypothetical protein